MLVRSLQCISKVMLVEEIVMTCVDGFCLRA